jgi:hypothetical protein
MYHVLGEMRNIYIHTQQSHLGDLGTDGTRILS